MAKFTFKKDVDVNNPYDNCTIEFTFESVDLSVMLENMEAFVKACGYNPKGTLDFTEEEE